MIYVLIFGSQYSLVGIRYDLHHLVLLVFRWLMTSCRECHIISSNKMEKKKM